MEIIIKGKEQGLKRLKGQNISEFGKNLESHGWPSEFRNEGEKDRIKYLEKKLGRVATKNDLKKNKEFINEGFREGN